MYAELEEQHINRKNELREAEQGCTKASGHFFEDTDGREKEESAQAADRAYDSVSEQQEQRAEVKRWCRKREHCACYILIFTYSNLSPQCSSQESLQAGFDCCVLVEGQRAGELFALDGKHLFFDEVE